MFGVALSLNSCLDANCHPLLDWQQVLSHTSVGACQTATGHTRRCSPSGDAASSEYCPRPGPRCRPTKSESSTNRLKAATGALVGTTLFNQLTTDCAVLKERENVKSATTVGQIWHTGLQRDMARGVQIWRGGKCGTLWTAAPTHRLLSQLAHIRPHKRRDWAVSDAKSEKKTLNRS